MSTVGTISVKDLVDHFGTVDIMSKAIGVSKQCIYNWERRGGVSRYAATKIELITFGKFTERDIKVAPRKNRSKLEADLDRNTSEVEVATEEKGEELA